MFAGSAASEAATGRQHTPRGLTCSKLGQPEVASVPPAPRKPALIREGKCNWTLQSGEGQALHSGHVGGGATSTHVQCCAGEH